MQSQQSIETIIGSWKVSHTVQEMLQAFILWEKNSSPSEELKRAVWNDVHVQKSVRFWTAFVVAQPYYLSAPYEHRKHENQKQAVISTWPIIREMYNDEELDKLIREENENAAKDNAD
jgi:hypothetical protein